LERIFQIWLASYLLFGGGAIGGGIAIWAPGGGNVGPVICPGGGVLKSGGGTFIGGKPGGGGTGLAVDKTGYFLLKNKTRLT